MEYIDYLICFVVGVWVGKKLHEILFQAMMHRAMKELGLTNNDLRRISEHMDQKLKEQDGEESDGLTTIEIKVEKHNDTLYAFRKDNDAFLGQGATREDLINRLAIKMKNVKLTISKEDGAELIGGSFHYNVENGKITGSKE